MEAKLWEGDFPYTPEWYESREHAPHAEQPIHQPRMEHVATMASWLIPDFDIASCVDLGAGDGGLIQMIGFPETLRVPPWGYDLMEVNVNVARSERQVDVRFGDFVNDDIEWGQLAICTEVLEHLEDPHKMVRRIAEHCDFLIASSPALETAESHDAVHAWAWDMEGYRLLMEGAGYTVIDHQRVEGDFVSQVIICGMM